MTLRSKLFAGLSLALSLTYAGVGRADGTPPQASAPLSIAGTVIVSQELDQPDSARTIIRGDAARYLFDTLPESLDQVITRDDGTTFKARVTTGLGCSVSTTTSVPRYACIFYLSKQGDLTGAVFDPGFHGTARISVSN